MRRWGAFSPGEGVGGAGLHWTGHHWRFLPNDFVLKSQTLARYGARAIPDYMTIEDWGVTYDELEPHFDRFDKLCGTSGKAGNLRGTLMPGGNPFEGVRSSEYPNKPLKQSHAGELFEKAANELGYHPFPLPASNASAPYLNSEGVQIGACQYCGFCTRYGCEANAKASANVCLMPVLRKEPKFELRTRAYVASLVYDKASKKVTGVTYVDLRTGEEYEQPAGVVALCGYVFANTQLMLLAGIGEPYDPASGKGAVTHIQQRPRPKLFHVLPGQSTHNTGGTIMGTDPETTVVNRYLQAWDAHDLFVMGASVFPQNAGYNPTGTVGALAYWSANAITGRYIKSPGPLV
jgi:gluconate 2-dehydrogenase alpha chain